MPKPRNPWLSIEPGELRHQITFQNRSTSQDASGQPVETYTPAITVWAKISAITQKEQFRAGLLTSEVSHIVKCRYQPGVAIYAGPKMRAVYAGHTYLLQAVENVEERNLVLLVYVLEINATE